MALLRLRKTSKWGAGAFDRCQTAQLELFRTLAVEVAPGTPMRNFFLRDPFVGTYLNFLILNLKIAPEDNEILALCSFFRENVPKIREKVIFGRLF